MKISGGKQQAKDLMSNPEKDWISQLPESVRVVLRYSGEEIRRILPFPMLKAHIRVRSLLIMQERIGENVWNEINGVFKGGY